MSRKQTYWRIWGWPQAHMRWGGRLRLKWKVWQKMWSVFRMSQIIAQIFFLQLLPRMLSIQSRPMWNIKVCVEGRDSWQSLIGFTPRHGATLLCLCPKQKKNVYAHIHMLIFMCIIPTWSCDEFSIMYFVWYVVKGSDYMKSTRVIFLHKQCDTITELKQKMTLN